MFKLKETKVRAIGYTRYVSIPKSWLENKGINEGDQVNLWLNKNGNIEIAPVAPSGKNELQNAASTTS